MSKKKKFVTIFPSTENIHLIKDVGIIPYLMHKNHHYDSYIASYDNGSYEFLQTDVSGLKIVFINRKFKSEFLNIILFLLTFKKIDVLQLYHYSFERIILCFLFKLITFGRGKTYIKLDANEKIFNKEYRGFKKILNKIFIKFVDLISAETQTITQKLNSRNFFGKKVEFISNGFYQIKNEISFGTKRKQCITVANLDDPRKSSITLVKGFALFCKNNPSTDWEFILIGKYDEKFKKDIEAILKVHPEAKNKIFLRGQIYNRNELRNIYEQSQIFLFASLTESFGFVYLEALASRCYILSTPLEPCREISNNWEFATCFDFNDYKELANLIELTIKNNNLKEITQRGQNYAYENYYWPNIIEKISNLIN